MEFPFETKVFNGCEDYSMGVKTIEPAVYFNLTSGISTRNYRNVVESLDLENVYASYVSSLYAEFDATVKSFLERSIDRPMKFIYIDATNFKVRDDGKYRNKALCVGIGINLKEEGRYLR